MLMSQGREGRKKECVEFVKHILPQIEGALVQKVI